MLVLHTSYAWTLRSGRTNDPVELVTEVAVDAVVDTLVEVVPSVSILKRGRDMWYWYYHGKTVANSVTSDDTLTNVYGYASAVCLTSIIPNPVGVAGCALSKGMMVVKLGQSAVTAGYTLFVGTDTEPVESEYPLVL